MGGLQDGAPRPRNLLGAWADAVVTRAPSPRAPPFGSPPPLFSLRGSGPLLALGRDLWRGGEGMVSHIYYDY